MLIFPQIRLMRTASEWSQSYRFWSCADIDIVKRGTLDDQQLCSKHGKHDKNGGLLKKIALLIAQNAPKIYLLMLACNITIQLNF